MATELAALGVGAGFGFAFALMHLPIPAPPNIAGALGVVGVTVGYLVHRWLLG